MSIEMLLQSLENLALALDENGFKAQGTDHWGWQGTPLSASDLAAMSRQLAVDIKRVEWVKLDVLTLARFGDLASRVEKLRSTVLPQLSSGPMAFDAVLNTILGIEILLRSFVSKDVLLATAKAASILGRRIQASSDELDSSLGKLDGLEKTTERILRAADAAERLDGTMQDFDDAVKSLASSREAVLKSQLAAEESERMAAYRAATAKARAEEADSVMKQIHSAYGAATTVGLARSFDEKAKQLNKSMGVWVLVLFGALLLGVLVGQQRFPTLMSALDNKPEWGVVAMHMVISALSLGPGVWLAWIATKQIGQRFRLAEDYDYKASLAKAYEGYRTEAAKLDPMFSSQLFAIALGRLEELPLRTIDKDIAGSPLNDLLQSREFKEQVEKLPDFKEILGQLLQRVLPSESIKKWKDGLKEKAPPKKETEE
jgi:hypothetical protein